MKTKRLFLLATLLLTAGNMMATVVDGIRQRPEPTTSNVSTIPTDKNIYLYNSGAKMFFTSGNDWNTRASVDVQGQPVFFTITLEAAQYGENVLELKSYVPKFSQYRSAFADGPASVWTDNNSSSNRFWVTFVKDGAIRLTNLNVESNLYLGWNPAANDTRLYLLEENAEGVSIDWMVVTENNYSVYCQNLLIFEKAQELKGVIDHANLIGVDASAAQSLYLDETTPIEALQTAIDNLKTVFENQASANNPVDVTSKYIVNSSYSADSNEGWEGSTPAFQTYGNAEFFSKTFNTYQNLPKLTPGIYALGLQAYYRAGELIDAYRCWKTGLKQNARLYVEFGDAHWEIPVKNIYDGAGLAGLGVGEERWRNDIEPLLYNPNNMQAAAGYFDAGRYHNTLFFSITGDEDVRIGLIKDELIQSDWTMFDNWTLTYYGNDNAAYQVWAEKMAQETPTLDGITATQSLLDAYLTLRNNTPTVTSETEAVNYLEQLEQLKNNIIANSELWNQYNNLLNNAVQMLQNVIENGKENHPQVIELSDYTTNTAPAIQTTLALDNDGLQQEIEKLQTLINGVVYMETFAGDDVTRYLKNPDFSFNKEGWTGWGSATGGNYTGSHPTTGGSPNICAESYDANNFDLYQEVNDAPVGVYEISVQGFSRIGRNDGSTLGNAWIQFQQTHGKDKMPVYVYLNDNNTNFKDIHEEPQTREFYSDETVAAVLTDGHVDSLANNNYYSGFGDDDLLYFPNTMTGASYAFTKGLYVNSAFGAVVNEGDMLRLGVKGSTYGPNWVIFDNFKLTFWGKQADKVKIALDLAITDLEGLADACLPELKTELTSRLNEGRTASTQSSTNGDVMFNALTNLYNIKKKIQTVNDQILYIKSLNDQLLNSVDDIYNNWSTTLMHPYYTFINEVNNKIESYQIESISALTDSISSKNTEVGMYRNAFNTFVLFAENAPTEEEIEGNLVTAAWISNYKNLYNTVYNKLYPNSAEDGMQVDEIEDYVNQMTTMRLTKYDMPIVEDQDNLIYIAEGIELVQGTTCALPISLKNDQDIVAAQFDILLPEGISLALTPRGKNDITVNGERTESHTISSNIIENGFIRIVVTSLENETFYDNDGIMLNINVVVPEDMAEGYYNVPLINAKLTNANRETINCADRWDFTVSVVRGGTPGDVNDDSFVDVTDVSLIIDNILRKPVPNFNERMADVNKDGYIDVTDVSTVIDVILKKVVLARGMGFAQTAGTGTLSMNTTLNLAAGQTACLPLTLTNSTLYCAFQMDINVPEGTTLKGIDYAENTNENHLLAYNRIADGKYRVIGWSMSNEVLQTENGELLRLNIESNGSNTPTTLSIDQIVFVTTDGTRQEMAAINALGEATGINTIGQMMSHGKVYDMQGRRINASSTKNSVILVNGKKIIVK